MRKIVVHMSMSLDGFFEGPDHDIGWGRVDDEQHAFINQQLAAMSAFLLGRVTYELMDDFWPTADAEPDISPSMAEFAPIWRDMTKVVYSRTLQTADENSTIEREVDPDRIRALKEQPGGDMTVGGPDLIETFRRHDLIDEYRIYLNPVLVGAGSRLFGPADHLSSLELLETRTFGNGVVFLRHGRPGS